MVEMTGGDVGRFREPATLSSHVTQGAADLYLWAVTTEAQAVRDTEDSAAQQRFLQTAAPSPARHPVGCVLCWRHGPGQLQLFPLPSTESRYSHFCKNYEKMSILINRGTDNASPWAGGEVS